MRKLIFATIVASFTALSGCALVTGSNGEQQTAVVGCEATSPAKSIACASATISALSVTTEQQLSAGRISQEQARHVQDRLETAYSYVQRAEQLAALNDGHYSDYLGLTDSILTVLEQELK